MGGRQTAALLFLVRGLPGLLDNGVEQASFSTMSRPAHFPCWALWCALEIQLVNTRGNLINPAQVKWASLIGRAHPLPGSPIPLHIHTLILHFPILVS